MVCRDFPPALIGHVSVRKPAKPEIRAANSRWTVRQNSILKFSHGPNCFAVSIPACSAEACDSSLQKTAGRRRGAVESRRPFGDLHIVIVGRLRATQTTVPDGQQVIIRYVGPGEFVGFTALSGGAQHPGSATPVDETILAWAWPAIRLLMKRHSALAIECAVDSGPALRTKCRRGCWRSPLNGSNSASPMPCSRLAEACRPFDAYPVLKSRFRCLARISPRCPGRRFIPSAGC